MEVWKSIAGLEGSYEVSSHGRVRSLDRVVRGHVGEDKRVKGIVLKPGLVSGYPAVFLKGKTRLVHRLVAQAFIPNPQNKPEVNHLDHVRTNNRVENLEWVTSNENVQHGVREGIHAYGERQGASKLTTNQVLEAKELRKSGFTLKQLGDNYGVTASTIGYAIRGKSWKHLKEGL